MKKKHPIDEIAEKARAAGKSYGRYVAEIDPPKFEYTLPLKSEKPKTTSHQEKKNYFGRKVEAYAENGVIVGQFESAAEAAEAFGYTAGWVRAICMGKMTSNLTRDGVNFRYITEGRPSGCPVVFFEADGEIIEVFNSAYAAHKRFPELGENTIRSHCKAKTLSPINGTGMLCMYQSDYNEWRESGFNR